MEEPAVVPHPTGDAGGLPNPPPTHGGSDHTDTPRGCASSTASTGCMAYLRQRYQDKKNSEEGNMQSCCLHHRDRSLQNLMTHYLASGLTGVINVPFQEL